MGRPDGGSGRFAPEHGQVTLLAAAVLAVAVALLLGLGRLGAAVVARAGASAAADAVALAAAGGGEGQARAVAAANHATLLEIDVRPGWAQVTVRRGAQQATATAVLVAEPAGP